MEIVFATFIIFPFGAALVGALYVRMYFKLKAVSSLVAGLLWASYSVYEFLMSARILCSGECNIRIDLLIIYPLLIVVSIVSTGLYYYKRKTFKAVSR